MATKPNKNNGEREDLVAQPSIVRVQITPPNMQRSIFRCLGNAPISVNRFGEKARKQMEDKQKAGSKSKKGEKREPKNFEELYKQAQYRAAEGWCGMHAAAMRNAMISACRLVGFKMTIAKLSVFVEPDGIDERDGTELIRIWGPEPEMWIAPVRNDDGSFDLRPRPRWKAGTWEIRPKLRYDGDQFFPVDVANLLARVGAQVGLGEGRPDSKKSAGLGYGLFEVVSADDTRELTEKAA